MAVEIKFVILNSFKRLAVVFIRIKNVSDIFIIN